MIPACSLRRFSPFFGPSGVYGPFPAVWGIAPQSQLNPSQYPRPNDIRPRSSFFFTSFFSILPRLLTGIPLRHLPGRKRLQVILHRFSQPLWRMIDCRCDTVPEQFEFFQQIRFFVRQVIQLSSVGSEVEQFPSSTPGCDSFPITPANRAVIGKLKIQPVVACGLLTSEHRSK